MEIINVIMIHSFNHFDSAEAANKRDWWGLRPANLLKKRLSHKRLAFPADFAKFLRTSFLQNNSGWLLLTGAMKLNVRNSNVIQFLPSLAQFIYNQVFIVQVSTWSLIQWWCWTYLEGSYILQSKLTWMLIIRHNKWL